MAETTSPGVPSSYDRDNGDLLRRHRLARLVIVGSFLTIFLMVAALLGIAGVSKADTVNGMAEKTFNTILPVVASWVGIVLAFYFSAASMERTSRSLDRVLDQAAGAPRTGVSVSEKMIPFNLIRELHDLAKEKPDQIDLVELKAKFTETNNTAPVTRLIFVDNGVFRYVLHIGTLNAFLLERGSDPSATTFAQILAEEKFLAAISKLVVFVAASASLADAKAALNSVPGAQDIIVTGTGKASEPMLGWITNVDLVKALTVS